MIQEAKNSMTLQKGLEYRFLYHDDPTSIHLLLALLENDMKIKRLKPKYMCMKALKRSLGRIFAHREDKREMAAAIYKSINNDINRLELAIYLESYAFGYKDLQWVNMLEAAAIKSIPIEELYNRNVLFHTNMNNEALVVKNRLLVYLDGDKEQGKHIKKITYTYCERVIKDKVFALNNTVNRQLAFDLNQSIIKIKEDSYISRQELGKIYGRIYMSCIKSMYRIYKEAYWFGINDKVISRYS